MANRYLVASGNWSGPVWSPTFGGTPGSAATPTTGDVVFADTGDYTLDLDINTATVGTVYLGQGVIFNLNGYSFNCDNILSEYDGTCTLNCSSSSVNITYGLTFQGTTSAVINMQSSVWVITNVTDQQSGFNLLDSTTTINPGNSSLTMNLSYLTTALQFRTASQNFNIVVLNLGASNANAVTVDITGSPTFSALVISSVNSSSHDVIFDGSGNTVNVSNMYISGASRSNLITLTTTGSSNTSIKFSENGSCYGNYVDITGGAYSVLSENSTGSGAFPRAYIGSNSADGTGTWLQQDTPKASSLVDGLTVAPTSSTNWKVATYSGATLPSSTTTGVDGGGYQFGNKQGIISTDTYDIVDDAIIIELPPILLGTDSNNITMWIGLGKSDGSSYFYGTGVDAQSGFGFSVDRSNSDITGLTQLYNGAGTGNYLLSLPTSQTNYLKIAYSSSDKKVRFYTSTNASAWILSATTTALTATDEMFLRSSRITITSFPTGTYSQTTDIGSINVLPTAPAQTGSFLPFFMP